MHLQGRTFGEFTLREKIGEGGFAVVHRAYQQGLEREAVIKLLHARLAGRPDVTQRFLRESKLASRLDHPYAAHVYAFGAETDGTLWIAMEMVRGTPMDKLLETQGPIPLDRFVPLFERICEVVQTAHERGIVHRDLKPGNVMVITRAGKMLPKLLDFGIARVVDEVPRAMTDTVVPGGEDANPTATREGAIMGSPLYMAPEQWADAASVGPASDIYALGVLAFEALTGRPPFAGVSMNDVMVAHAHQPVPALGDGFPEALHPVIARAMAKLPRDRHASANDFAAALRAAAGLGDTEVVPQLDDPLREAIAAGAPQPLAEAVAALEAARNIDQACAILWDVVLVATRWVGVLALASRTKVGPGGDTDAADARELLRELGRDRLDEEHWLALARALARPFVRRRDAYPVPELVSLLHGDVDFAITPSERTSIDQPGPPFFEAFHRLRALRHELDRRAGKSDDQRRELFAEALVAVAELLRPLRFLLDYTVVVPRRGRCERWRGLRRQPRPAVVRRARPLPDGEAVLLDVDGSAVLQLAPLVQVAEPAPGKDAELFVFDGKGAGGARLVAIPQGFERHDPTLADWFRAHLFDTQDGAGDVATEEVAPYRGLAPFTPSDAAFYFGREREIDGFLNRLRVEAMLAVVGPSGAGKSSFVQAGVLPRLPTAWRAILVRPGPSPIAALEARLEREAIPVRDVARDPGALAQALRAIAARDGATLVLVVDQLEELFTLCHDDAEREAFAAAIVGAARTEDDPVRVIVTVRDDFLIRAEAMPALRDRLSRGLKLLTTPAVEDLERILTAPAERVGYQFEDRALVTEMVEEVAGQPGALALLSFTAAELWKLRDRHFHQLQRKAYKSLGGVGGALARHAELMLAGLTADEQRLAREAFRHLVTAEGTRQVLSLAELRQLLGGGARADAVVDRLVGARLLVVSDEAGGEQRIEVIHEALLTAWPRLVQWRQEDAEGARLRDQLRTAARQWDQRGRPRGLLWRDDALAEYRIWRARYPGALTDVEEAFAATSLSDAARGRRLRRGLLVGAFAVMAVGLTVMIQLRQRAAEQGALAEQRAKENQEQLVRSYEERGQQALLAGETNTALVFLAEALAKGADRPAVRFMIARALEPLQAEVAELRGHTKQLWGITFSPDGTRLLTAGHDGTARIWNANDGRELRQLAGHAPGQLTAAWSSDGNSIATGDAAGAVRLWRADGVHAADLAPSAGAVSRVVFSADGGLVGAASRSDGRIRIWNARTTELVAAWDADRAGDLAFHPSLYRIVTSSSLGPPAEPRPSIWSVRGKRLQALVGHHDAVWYSRFDPRGERVATSSADGTARIWNLDGSSRLLAGHDGRVTYVAWDPSGRYVATAGMDRTGRIWDAREASPIAVLRGHAAQVNRTLFSPDGAQVVTVAGDGTARVWDVVGGLQVAAFSHRGFLFDADISRDGSRLATASWSGTGKIWDLRRHPRLAQLAYAWDWLPSAPPRSAGERFIRFGEHGAMLWTDLSRAGREITTAAPVTGGDLSADGKTIVLGLEDGSIEIVNADDGSRRHRLVDQGAVSSIAFVAASQFASCHDNDVRLWDAITGRLIARQQVASPFGGLAVSPAAKRFFAFDPASDTAVLLSATDLKPIARVTAGRILAASISPDGSRLITGSEDGLARVWDLDGRELARRAHQAAVTVLAWRGGGPMVVTGSSDGGVTLWNTATRTVVAHRRGHDSFIAAAAFTPDAKFAITTSGDGSIKIWDGETLAQLASIPHDDRFVRSILFDRQGHLLASTMERTNVWSMAEYTGGPEDLASLVRCKVPQAIIAGRLVEREPTACD